jgi:hypothetical protein
MTIRSLIQEEAARQLEESVRRLQPDCIDLGAAPRIVRYEDPHGIAQEEGAQRTLIQAQYRSFEKLVLPKLVRALKGLGTLDQLKCPTWMARAAVR